MRSNFFKNQSLISNFTIIAITVTLMGIAMLGGLNIYRITERGKQQDEDSRRLFLEKKNEYIRSQTTNIVQLVDLLRSQTNMRVHQLVKSRTLEAVSIAENIYAKSHMSKEKEQIAQDIREALRPIRFKDGRGYFFAFDMDGIERLAPTVPDRQCRHQARAP